MAAWPARLLERPGADDLAQAPLLLAMAASHALHELGKGETALQYLARGEAAEAAGGETSCGWLAQVAGRVALWSGHVDEFMGHHARTLEQACAEDTRDVALEIIDTSTAAYLLGSRKDEPGARALVERLNALEDQVSQPSLVGYIFFGRAGLSIARGSDDVVSDLEAAMQWAEIGGNILGMRRIKSALADRLSRGSAPERQISVHTELLRELPEQGTAIYIWLTANRLIAPLAATKRYEEMVILAGALSTSPISHSASASAYLDEAREALGADAFEAAFARGTSFSPKEAHAFAKSL